LTFSLKSSGNKYVLSSIPRLGRVISVKNPAYGVAFAVAMAIAFGVASTYNTDNQQTPDSEALTISMWSCDGGDSHLKSGNIDTD
jgi:hypothetical protein